MYIHSKLTLKNNLYKYLIALIPLIMYGIYKNGFLVYQKQLINIFYVFKPLLLVLIVVAIYYIFNIIFNKKYTLDNKLISYIIIAMIMMPLVRISYFIGIVIIMLLLDKLLDKKISFNKIALARVLMALTMFLFSTYSYKTLLESNYAFSYGFIDYLFGRQIGGISSTSIILMLISYVYLSYGAVYKKEIPIIIYGTYLIGAALYCIFKNTIDLNILMNSNILFASIFVATESISSPYNKKNTVIYSVLIGVLTIILSAVLNFYEGIYIAILICSILLNFIEKDRFFLRNEL